MPEILTRGKLPSEIEYTATCTNCGTRFKFKKGEATERGNQRDGTYLVIACPLPGCFHSVSKTLTESTRSHHYMDR